MDSRTDRQICTEHLMSPLSWLTKILFHVMYVLILGKDEIQLAHNSKHACMNHDKSPNYHDFLPIPHTPIVLAKYCSRFQYTQISSNSLLNFRWKSRIIESISEQLSILFQCIIIIQPVVCNILYTAKPTAIPRAVIPSKLFS